MLSEQKRKLGYSFPSSFSKRTMFLYYRTFFFLKALLNERKTFFINYLKCSPHFESENFLPLTVASFPLPPGTTSVGFALFKLSLEN